MTKQTRSGILILLPLLLRFLRSTFCSVTPVRYTLPLSEKQFACLFYSQLFLSLSVIWFFLVEVY